MKKTDEIIEKIEAANIDLFKVAEKMYARGPLFAYYDFIQGVVYSTEKYECTPEKVRLIDNTYDKFIFFDMREDENITIEVLSTPEFEKRKHEHIQLLVKWNYVIDFDAIRHELDCYEIKAVGGGGDDGEALVKFMGKLIPNLTHIQEIETLPDEVCLEDYENGFKWTYSEETEKVYIHYGIGYLSFKNKLFKVEYSYRSDC